MILRSYGKLYFEHLNLINWKRYSQTCSKDHLCTTTNAESAQTNSHPIVTVQDNHMSNATSNHFFLTPKWKKKNLVKQQLQNFIQQRNAKKTNNNA